MKIFALQSALAALLASSVLAIPAPAPVPAFETEPAAIPEQHGPEPEKRQLGPVIDIPAGGKVRGRSLLGVEVFNGIPYADPPVGPLRLRPPRKFSGKLGTVDGTGLAAGCPQQFTSQGAKDALSKIIGTVLHLPLLKEILGREDCLTIDVGRSAGTKAGDKLPVLFWIYGGGFALGSTNTYEPTSLLSYAKSINQPFIYVAVNYRVGGFGFLPGKEVLADGAANLGLLDQRMGLEWVQDNIEAFGGDPTKVTIWGESAGAISVFDQMLMNGGNATYKGKQLFRGAIMNSGSIIPVDPVDCDKGQAVYNSVVDKTGCSGAPDTLACLREAPYDKYLAAVNSQPSLLSYSAVALSYLPRPDGRVLEASPDKLWLEGKYTPVPMIIGDQEDEGTLFSVFQTNITSQEAMVDYLSSLYFTHAPKEKLSEFVSLYEPAILQGSPFRTGLLNELYPGFKRMAAILGDVTFQTPRRLMLRAVTQIKPDVPVWSYISSYDYGTPILGTFHASDILQTFYGIFPNNAMKSTRTYYFNFLYNLDPNKGAGRFGKWPQWKEDQQLMWFQSPFSNGLMKDDFRTGATDWVEQNKEMLYY
ncbi:hypothetical protein HIM_02824 [Hirsutella minnesotensis 3608]|nr:hypothetical protein HIM_02824 [Hirsutella minnesotensis 3608]